MAKKQFIFVIILLSTGLKGQIVINEVMVSNLTTAFDDTYNYAEYVEIYNTGTTSYNLSSLYLSDDRNQLLKWKLPESNLGGKKFRVIWCDKKNKTYSLHSSFLIKPGTEGIYLTSSSGKIMDSVFLGKQFFNSAYGRYPDGSSNWIYFNKGTPGSANTGKTGSKQLEGVQFSMPGGFYSGKQTIMLSAPRGAIYYTTNGSEPTELSTLYKGPIVIDTTTVIRAAAFEEGYIASTPVTHTYFINQRNFSLPVISISTDPKFFFDDIIGIYVAGTNGVSGMCSNTPVNWNQDWERTINFEYFDAGKRQQVNQLTGTRINGNCSRTNPQKSLGIYARDKYGKDHFDYSFFPYKKHIINKTLLLRNSGNEWNVTMIRDAFHHKLAEGRLNIDYLDYQPAVLFLNGKYWGIHNIREKPDDNYIESNYHIDNDSLDLLQNNASVDNGSNAGYVELINYIKNNDITLPQHYEYVCSRMDVDNYLDYLILEMFIANTDWPGNNIRYWRSWQPGAKWRWIIFDTDFGFGYSKSPSFNMLTFSTQEGLTAWPNPDWSTFLIRTMLKNDSFKNEFINRFSIYMGCHLRSERCIALIDSLAANIQSEMPYHLARWNSSSNWTYNLEVMRNFARQRPDFVYEHLQQFFNLGTPLRLQINSTVKGASWIINNVLSPDTVFKGKYFKNNLLRIQPLPPPGYRFSHWKIHYDYAVSDYLIKKGAVWKYYDTSMAPPAGWNSLGFDDSQWKSGPAELGYGDGDEKTILSYGGNANNKFISYYFRKTFTINDTSLIKEAMINAIFDDGIVIYLNGNEVIRNSMPSGTITWNTLASANNENASLSVNISTQWLKNGENVIAAEVHQNSVSSSDVSFDLSLSYVMHAAVPPDTVVYSEIFSDTMRYEMTMTVCWKPDTTPVPSLFINEICASNATHKDEYGEKDDWLEIYNPNPFPVDMAGMFLTDSLAMPFRYRIPSGFPQLTTIPPHGHLQLWADEQPGQGKLHLPFRFDRMGEQLGLCCKKGEQMIWIDTLSFGYQDNLYTYGRYPDGTTAWQYMPATPAAPNQKGYIPDSTIRHVRINEICANNTLFPDEQGHYHDWLEIYNPTTDSIDLAGLLLTDTFALKGTCRIPYGYREQTIIPPSGYKIIWCDNKREEGPLHVNLKLNKDGEMAGIYQLTGRNIVLTDTLVYPAQRIGLSYGRYPDGSDSVDFMPYTPGQPNRKLPERQSLSSSAGCRAWPNPAESFVTTAADFPVLHLSLFNAEGIKIATYSHIPSPFVLTVSDFPPGIYFIRVEGEENVCHLKIIKH